MRGTFKLKREEGFSLVELMVVVGIIGILATLAMPRFKQFQAKAKMGEAKNLLSHLYTLEQSYALDTNVFVAAGPIGAGLTALNSGNVCTNAGATTLGFTIDPCAATTPTPRYSYRVAVTNTTFMASAATGALAFNRVCQNNAAHWHAVDNFNGSGSGAGTAPGAPAATVTASALRQVSSGTLCAN